MQAPKGHTLHRRTTQIPASLGVDANRAQSKKEERRDAAAVGRLQKDMNAMTDARVLHTARNDQASKSMPSHLVVLIHSRPYILSPLYLIVLIPCRPYVSSSLCLVVPMSRRPYLSSSLCLAVLIYCLPWY